MLCNEYKRGGLKHYYISNKIISFHCWWIRRICDNWYHEWKLIPLFLIKKLIGNSFKFSFLFFKRNKIKFFPSFYREIFLYWKYHLTRKPEMSRHLWYNENIPVDENSMDLVRVSEKNINYVFQLFGPDGSIKTWHWLRTEYELYENSYFQWLLLLIFIIKKVHKNKTNFTIHDHYVMKGSRVLALDKLASSEIYSISISQNKPNFHFKNLFDGSYIDWPTIYVLPRLATYNIYMRSFQYKLLNNVLFSR